MPSAADNLALLDRIYRGQAAGPAFLVQPPFKPLHEPPGDYTLSDRPVADWVPDIAEHYATQVGWLEELDDDTVPVAHLTTGTHLYAAAFGCPVHEYEDTNPAALPIVTCATEADAIPEPDLWSCPGLVRVFELGHAVQAELGEDVWLGPPDIQTGFDTAALIWDKSDFYAALIAEPAAVHRLVGKCARLLSSFLAELRREFPRMVPAHCPRLWAPPDLGWWVSNDECGAFGTEVFREFCLPEMVELSERFGSFGMHCCADAEHQFPAFREIPNFYAFNRVAGRRGWDTLLPAFQGPDAPVHVLGWLDPALIAHLRSQAAEGTRFIFVHGAMDLEDGRRWLEEVRR